MAQVYIKEVFLKYRVLDKIILNKNTRFILAFGKYLQQNKALK